MEWEDGPDECHAYLDNGLHLRVVRIDPPRGKTFYTWSVHDPFIRVPVASSGFGDITTLEEAKRQVTAAAERIKPWGTT